MTGIDEGINFVSLESKDSRGQTPCSSHEASTKIHRFHSLVFLHTASMSFVSDEGRNRPLLKLHHISITLAHNVLSMSHVFSLCILRQSDKANISFSLINWSFTEAQRG